MRDLSTRIAQQEDEDFLFLLHREALGPYVDAIWGWDDDVQRSMFAESFTPAVNEIIEWTGAAIGCLRATEADEDIHLDYLALLPGWQNRGIGTYLVKGLQQRAQSLGVPVRLSVLQPNPARRLYERLGFRVTGEDDIRIRMQWQTR